MKRQLSFIPVILLMALSSLVCASDETTSSELPRFNVRFYPFGLLSDYTKLDFDIGFGDSWSVGPSVGYYSKNIGIAEAGALLLGGRVNYFLNGKRFTSGLYAGGTVELVPLYIRVLNYEVNDSIVRASGVFGYQYFFGKSFNMAGGLGLRYTMSKKELNLKSTTGESENIENPFKSGIAPMLELTVGYAF